MHRVQRVPDTEGAGRIHTSAATVAVLPEAEEVDIVINEGDLRIDTCAPAAPAASTSTRPNPAIRVIHLPTGIEVKMQEDRSQHRNRAKAMAVLRARLYDHERQKLDAARAAERRGQVGSGDRSERIRTYNFPQGRVSDHRINLTLYKLPQIIEGEALGEIIDALVTEHQAELLAARRRDATAAKPAPRCPSPRRGAGLRSSSATPASTRPTSTRGCWSAMRSRSITPHWRRRPIAASPVTRPTRSRRWRAAGSPASRSRASSA